MGRRRAEIRKNRPDRDDTFFGRLVRPENHVSLLILIGFVVGASTILMMRPSVLEWREGQYAPYDVVARVDFKYHDPDRLNEARKAARLLEPRVYKPAGDTLAPLREELIALPDAVKDQRAQQLAEPYRSILDDTSIVELQGFADPSLRTTWKSTIEEYIAAVRGLRLIVLPDAQRQEDLGRQVQVAGFGSVRTDDTFSPDMTADLQAKLSRPAAVFPAVLQPRIVAITLKRLAPNYELDDHATTEARNRAAAAVADEAGDVDMRANMIVLEKGEVGRSDFLKLKAEHDAYLASLGGRLWWQRLGLVGLVAVLSMVGTMYISRFQPRIIRNHARGMGLAALLVSMLLLAQLTGLISKQSYVFAIAPTIMVAMILAIAYDQRFALGIASIHAVLATIALGEDLQFFLILISGVTTCCFLLDDVRTRSKLIEVGGATALAMMAATVAAGWVNMDPFGYIVRNAIYSGAAGLAVGFLTLGVLPFIEQVFRITTSMTLLELADASHPLLRRLALEAPGTYNHSLQVATLAEEAAETIDGNSLLCRVASYYHDIGKINKSEYFVENQHVGMANRHINLTPSVSLLIIIGHVKDGVEMAKEYHLPTSFIPFIQQHHGTTLVEFFYHRARNEKEPLEREVEEHQYRYPGPKPRSKEVAIVMLADCCESACRAMDEPNANRIETLVHDLAMKRLLDGQFDECDLTMRELELIERSLVKSLLGLYHGRIAYPSDKDKPEKQPDAAPAAKTA